jgi:hypothetical protein
MQPRGVDKAPDSFPVYLLHCVIGHHGVLSLSPIFLFTLAGWAITLRQMPARLRRDGLAMLGAADLNWVHAMGLALTAVVLAFFLTRTENYNYGGVSVALRWLLWLVPLWLLAMLPAMSSGACTDSKEAATLRGPSAGGAESPSCGRVRTALGAVALAVSAFSAWYPWDNPWRQPWLFTLMENAGWIDYSDPAPKLERSTFSWVSHLPRTPARLEDYWVELSGTDIDGAGVSLRLSDGGPSGEGGQARVVDVTHRRDGEPDRTDRYWIAIAAFEAGEPPASFLVWPEGPPPAGQREAEIAFWSGLPRSASYSAAAERYLKLPLRTDAFHCIQAYAQVVERDERSGVSTRFRRDAWLCREVPFGVAQFETQVIDDQRQVIARQRMTMTAAGTLDVLE